MTFGDIPYGVRGYRRSAPPTTFESGDVLRARDLADLAGAQHDFAGGAQRPETAEVPLLFPPGNAAAVQVLRRRVRIAWVVTQVADYTSPEAEAVWPVDDDLMVSPELELFESTFVGSGPFIYAVGLHTQETLDAEFEPPEEPPPFDPSCPLANRDLGYICQPWYCHSIDLYKDRDGNQIFSDLNTAQPVNEISLHDGVWRVRLAIGSILVDAPSPNTVCTFA